LKALLDKQRRDSLAFAKQQAEEAKRDSLARKALADQQRKDSLALVKAALDQARRDSIAARQAQLRQQQDSINLARLNEKRLRDSLAQIKAKPVEDPAAYYFDPAQPHYALVVLDKVDPIFVGEARNAFTRYNREQFTGQPLEVQIIDISADTRMLVISGLPSARLATDYVTKTKDIAATEIIPWLKADKYSFSIISARNLALLKTKTDINEYKRFLEQHLPGRF
jgi:hypothetical protein